jgi:GDPmannose 4,6-dehydratase
MKKALITGITGQDGSYLAELLLSKGYEVHGLVRRSSTPNTSRINPFLKKLHIHYGDLSDSDQIIPIIQNVKPDEVYHLAAQSHVGMSFNMPEYTGSITALGTTRLLEAIRKNNPETKFYQASSSEMFGDAMPPQSESTPFQPVSPYACAKLYSYWMARNYRSAYKLFTVNGILFNHESPRRGEIFVTRKITQGLAAILAKKQNTLSLGNLEAYRDWGFAPEYVEGMWKMMQLKYPEDYVLGTGVTHTVKEFLDAALNYTGLDLSRILKSEEEMFRPTDVRILKASCSLAKISFAWQPKVSFEDLVKIMVDADLRAAGLESVGEGDEILKKAFPERWWKED